jgi:tetratricopeptide (TPR) repeat protein
MDKARQLDAAGRHAELVEYLEGRVQSELEESPDLALLYGSAQARLGRYPDGLQWLDRALEQARRRADQVVERRALNARGAVALVSGRLDEAADFFTQALMAASRDEDLVTTGRCSNNLGIIASLRGRQAEALGSWEIAVAAFERAGVRQGAAECHHNLAITYREQGLLDRALTEAGRAVADAEAVGERTLLAVALRGRVEIRLASGDVAEARREMDQVRAMRSRLPDPVNEAEDLRVAAALLAADGDIAAAERALGDVIAQAEAHGRPQLEGDARRDLALLLRRAGRNAEARAAARAARAIFARFGAEAEIRRLASLEWDDEFAAELRRSLEPLHEAQALADAGRYAELLAYLNQRPRDELEQSPLLALVCGIAHSRMGRLDVGGRWARLGLLRAQELGDRTLEVRALNVCGAIALERGGIGEATQFLARAQEEAVADQDMTALGRCANNLGIIANVRGDYPCAIGAYTRAIAAYQRAGYERGAAETHHNLGITYREQGQLDQAMQAADAALRGAQRLGDRALIAQALSGRAEIQIARGEPEMAIVEAERALAEHRALEDVVRETEDLRILAVALGEAGRVEQADGILREVVSRATAHERPLLAAIAQRDLVRLLLREGDVEEASQLAATCRAGLERLGATVEIGKLDALLCDALGLH